MKIQRTCKVSLKFITKEKQRKIKLLIKEYRRVVNLYIKSLWENKGSLNKETLNRILNTNLSQRYKSQALRQALQVVVLTRKSLKSKKKFGTCPHFSGFPVLDSKFITIELGKKSFDLAIKLSTLNKGNRITLLTKKTKPLNKWLNYPNAKLIQGCQLRDNEIILFIEFDIQEKQIGETLGIDLGINKLITTSNGELLGTKFKIIRDKLNRKIQGSKSFRKTQKERTNYINQQLNLLPWNKLQTLIIEDLKNLKLGKKKNRGKLFRKALSPWTYSQIISRIESKAQENRVCLVRVNPRNTSRRCPECGFIDKENRKNEKFVCLQCSHREDADIVGAKNILFAGSRRECRVSDANKDIFI